MAVKSARSVRGPVECERQGIYCAWVDPRDGQSFFSTELLSAVEALLEEIDSLESPLKEHAFVVGALTIGSMERSH